MALLKCPDCEKMVSPRVEACPFCGCPKEFFEEETQNETVDNKETIEENKSEVQNEINTAAQEAVRKMESIIDSYVTVHPDVNRDFLIKDFLKRHLKIDLFEEGEIDREAEIISESSTGRFYILGRELKISTETDNERIISNRIRHYYKKMKEDFARWYSNQSNYEKVLQNAEVAILETYMPLAKECITILSEQGIYSMTETMFLEHYCSGVATKGLEVLESMRNSIAGINTQEQREKYQREVRKESRGRVVGGGFGLGGALKGMATAGAINATTGMAHSLGNALGNLGSSISADSGRGNVYKNYKEPFAEAVAEGFYVIRRGLRKALYEEAGIKCQYVTDKEYERVESVVLNCVEGRIPENHVEEELFKALQTNPFYKEAYFVIWTLYGDKNGELRRMANVFSVSLQDKIAQIACEQGKEVFETVCEKYIQAFDKNEASVKYEADINVALEALCLYCAEQGIEEDVIPEIETCKSILKVADNNLKTVYGKLYKTRELARDVRTDYEKFYCTLKDRNIFEDGILELLTSQDYKTAEFKEIVNELFEQEQILRNPKNIFFSVCGKVTSYKNIGLPNTVCIDVPQALGSYESKVELVKTITGIAAEEVMICMFGRTANGKSAIAFTNQYVRIFNKGLFTAENKKFDINSVLAISCGASDEYVIDFVDGSKEMFSMKVKNEPVKYQINLGKLMNETLTLIKNIYHADLKNLYRVLYGKTTCVCGMLLLENENVCPSCKRMKKEDGTFVEATQCPGCGSYVPLGKKFCSKCGTSLLVEPNMQQNTQEMNNTYFTCDVCGNQVLKGKKFCSKCGYKFE